MDRFEIKVNNNNAVIYARYSSDKQNEQSIEGQIRVVKEYAKRNNIPIINTYIDRAISGRSDDRPEFQKMINDSKNRQFGYVLVYKFDRFSRDRYDSMTYKQKLKRNGVKVISSTEYISDDPQGIILESLIDGYSEYYSAELSQKVRRGNRESRLKGQFTGGPVIYGYKIENKKYVIVPEEAEIVKKMFIDVQNNVPFTTIAKELNEKGYTRKGKKFNYAFIQRAIHNQRYIGKEIINGELYTNIIPPIITNEQFELTAKACEKNTDKGNHTRIKNEYFLSTKMICGCCGHTYYGETGTSKTGMAHHYYKCGGRKKKLAKCDNKTFKQDEIEAYIVDKIKYLVLHSSYLDKIAKAMCEAYNSTLLEDAELLMVEKELQRNKKETTNIINVLASGITVLSVKEKLEKLEEEKQKLEIEYLKLKSKAKPKIDPTDSLLFLTKILSMNENSSDYKRIIIDRLVKKVEIYKDRMVILLYPESKGHVFITDDEQEDSNDNNGGTVLNELNEKGLLKPFKKKMSSSGDVLGSPFKNSSLS